MTITMRNGRLLAAMLAVAAALTMALFAAVDNAYADLEPTQLSYADGSPVTLENAKGTVYTASFTGDYAYCGLSGNGKGSVKSIKGGNEKVSLVGYENLLAITCERTGKANISYVWKGKRHKFTLVVSKYTSPVKVFKLGNRNYAKDFKERPTEYSYELKGKVKVNAKSGWKLQRIALRTYNSKSKKWASKVLKSGSNVSKKYGYLDATFKSAKSNKSVVVTLASY